ncbi:MAG: L,D-transpeptidase family protein [Hyphomicrobiaceae bacterium]|nr:MAG: L,D-transpeptidase family protein [Hyphomicrobiaceae bacterium]
MNRITGLAVVVVLGIAGLQSSALAQAQPAPEQSEPADPLTPQKLDGLAPRAPGAPHSVVPANKPAETSPVVALLLQSISQGKGTAVAHADDRKAVEAFYAENGGLPIWTSAEGYLPRARSAIEELEKAADFGLDPKAFVVPAQTSAFAAPSAQAEAELSLALAVLKYARHARGGRLDVKQISRMIDREPGPFEPKSVLAALSVSEDAAASLRRFQPQHKGFQNLRLALLNARKDASSAQNEQRILVNMERWRSMPDDLGAFYVLDNVPEQLTRVVDEGRVVFMEKIVVGKPHTPTPQFTAEMKFVIFHPSWGVPNGIKKNELAPLLRRSSQNGGWLFGFDGNGASRALARHGLRVYHGGREVNPDSIDWSRVNVANYSFTQPPGTRNVLGVVKFRFPNRHDVYMHDTTERHLFNSKVRAFSHGCMRVQNPLKLAEIILAHDRGWSAEKVQSLVRHGGTSEITLEKSLPVHVTYFTASADESGKLELYGDLYGLDARIASALAGRQVHIAADKTESAPERPASRRPAIRSQRPRQSQASNPFADVFKNW